MGILYQYGGGTDEPDMNKAIDWYEKSAENGNPIAQYQLATLYENGNGLPKDLQKPNTIMSNRPKANRKYR